MAESKETRFFRSRIFVPLILVALCLVVFAYARTLYRDYQIRAEITQMEDEVKRLQTKKVESLQMLQFVKSDAFAEAKARLELNLAKPGEQVVIIGSAIKPANFIGQKSEKVISLNNPSNISAWWHYFMGDPSSE
ncbi:MAG: septum formation initiator family protein [bacterium]|nr:septum formation initiator family protein [bacterium]